MKVFCLNAFFPVGIDRFDFQRVTDSDSPGKNAFMQKSATLRKKKSSPTKKTLIFRTKVSLAQTSQVDWQIRIWHGKKTLNLKEVVNFLFPLCKDALFWPTRSAFFLKKLPINGWFMALKRSPFVNGKCRKQMRLKITIKSFIQKVSSVGFKGAKKF